jgi:hypothetical protein
MSTSDTIRRTIEAFGRPAQDDYRIQPTHHARALEDHVPEIAEILRHSEVQVVARQFEEDDERAITAQARFRQIAGRAGLAVISSAILAVTLVFLGAFYTDAGTRNPGWPFLVAGSLGLILAWLGTMWIHNIREGALLTRWMESRARAESRRLQYFEAVTRPWSVAETSGLPVLQQQLEYFRRYQLDVQVAFYRVRATEHRLSGRRTLALSGWAAFLAGAATGLAGFLGAPYPPLASLASLAILGSALAAYAASRAAMNQDQRNAERYDRTRQALEQIESRLSEVRQAVAAGSRESLAGFVQAVHEQVSLEHRQWLSEADARSVGVRQLDETLASVRPGIKLDSREEKA